MQSTPCPIWSGWALDHLQVGLIMLDAQNRVVFANRWFLQYAGLESGDILNKTLLQVFPQLESSHFIMFLAQSISSGFPALLSQSLHPAPFPLYLPAAQRGQDKLLRQSIRIIPMGFGATAYMGQRYTMIQISDVTHSVLRERLLKAQASKLQGLANLDVLTGLGNRRMLNEKLAHEFRATVKAGTDLAVLMFDIDYFKQFNDIYGHLVGDTCLRQVADSLRDVCRRPNDVVARFGGEELVAILPETDHVGAMQVAQKVLQKVQLLQIPHSGSCVARVLSLSAGVATFSSLRSPLTPDALLGLADRALYEAKGSGRNRVCGFDAQGTLVVIKM